MSKYKYKNLPNDGNLAGITEYLMDEENGATTDPHVAFVGGFVLACFLAKKHPEYLVALTETELMGKNIWELWEVMSDRIVEMFPFERPV